MELPGKGSVFIRGNFDPGNLLEAARQFKGVRVKCQSKPGKIQFAFRFNIMRGDWCNRLLHGEAHPLALALGSDPISAISAWKGLAHFKAYVWSLVVAHDLALFSRLVPT